MQPPMAETNLVVLVSLIGAGAALLGALIGGGAMLLIDAHGRREKRRDEVRTAYSDWFTALDALTLCDTNHVSLYANMKEVPFERQLADGERAAAAAMLSSQQQRLDSVRDETVHRESAAFARLIIADAGTSECIEVDRIRKLSPFKTCNNPDKTTGNYVPDLDLFFLLEGQQAEDLGGLALRLKARFVG